MRRTETRNSRGSRRRAVLILYLGWLPNLYALLLRRSGYMHAIGGIQSGTTGEPGPPMLTLAVSLGE